MASQKLPGEDRKEGFEGSEMESYELSAFEKLPDELMEMIVIKLEKQDILKVMLVSSQINAMMSKSFKIWNKFEMKFPKIQDLRAGRYQDFLGYRKYSSFKFVERIRSDDIELASRFLQPYVSNIKRIKVFQIDDTILAEILSMCEGLESFEAETLWLKNLGPIEPLNLPKLKSLKFPPSELLHLFIKSPIRFFEARWKFLKYSDQSLMTLVQFLQAQRAIEELILAFTDHPEKLFEDASISDMEFKLKSLTVLNASYPKRESLYKFINKHTDSTTRVQIRWFDALDHVMRPRNV